MNIRHLRVLSCAGLILTTPNLALAQAAPVGQGPGTTWVEAGSTMNSIATAQDHYRNVSQPQHISGLGTRQFISSNGVHYGNSGTSPFENIQSRRGLDLVWGTKPNFFVTTFYGQIYVPPAPAGAASNTYSFNVSSDDGFRLRIHDGAQIRSEAYDANRGYGNGPILTVDFPVEGGLFPFDLLSWEQGGVFSIELSWAQGTHSSFNANTFSLIPAENLFGPRISATQTVTDLNGGTVDAGDTLEYRVTLLNDGQAAAWNLAFTPELLLEQTFAAFGSGVGTLQGSNLVIDQLDPGQSISFTYTTTVNSDASGNLLAQGRVVADSSNIGLGQAFIRALSDDPNAYLAGDIANLPVGLFPNRGGFDDDANVIVFASDITAPALTIDSPAFGAIINLSEVPISGTSETDATVTVVVYDDQNQIVFQGPAPMTGNNTWHITTSTLGEGDYTIEATSVDPAGNTAVETSMFTIDLTAPTLDITGPDALVNTDSPSITGTSSGADYITVVVSSPSDPALVLTFNNVPVDAQGNWSVNLDDLEDGTYAVRATATDVAGNVSPAEQHTFQVDTLAPVVVIQGPADGSSSANQRPDIFGTTEAGATVVITVTDASGQVFTKTTTAHASTGDWSITTDLDLDNGTYTIEATATDLAGNIGQPANSDFTVQIDLLALAITAPANGLHTQETKPAITGTTEPNTAVSVVLKDANNNETTLTTTSDANGDWSVTPDNDLADGAWLAAATVVNSQNEPSTANVFFVVDTTDPALTLDSPQNGDELQPGAITVVGTGEPGLEVVVTLTGPNGNQNHTVQVDPNGAWELPVTLTPGSYEVSATSTDDAGNTTTLPPVPFDVAEAAVAPNITLTSPANQSVTNTQDISLVGTATPGATVNITLDGTVVGTVTADQDGNWTFDLTGLTDGTYVIGAQASLNGLSSNTVQANVTVDTEAPAVTITTPTNNDTVYGPGITLVGTSEPGAVIEIFVGGNKVGETTAGTDGSWTFDTNLTAGTHEIHATATDAAGNVGTSDTIQITVEIEETVDDTATYLAGAGGCSTTHTTLNLFVLVLVGLWLMRRRVA